MVSLVCIVLTTGWVFGLDGPVDHTKLDAVLRKCVVADGVDYRAAKQEQASLQRYIASLADASLADLTGDERKALFINAYNAATLLLILEHWAPDFKSIKDIPENKRWTHRRWTVAGKLYSLDDMEHRVLRADYNDPRIHAAINCASMSCPALRAQAYKAEDLDSQLDDQAIRFVNHRRHVHVANRILHLSPIFDWFREDFGVAEDSVLGFLKRYGDWPLQKALDRLGPRPKIQFLEYDWSLNASSPPKADRPPGS